MTRNRNRPAALLLLAGLCLRLAAGSGLAQIRDGGIDPWNLGKGDWIYYVSMATNQLGGRVAAVTNLPSLMAWYTNAGVKHLIVKAGTGSTNFNGGGTSPQFNTNLVTQAHLKGLKIFGYTRSWGRDIPGEIAMATYVFNQGADGFVLDAEAEWEDSNAWIGTNGPALALQLGAAIRSNWPTKFLAHAPMPIISYHPSFPYKEFGLYCDAVMPQDYWTSFGKTPTAAVNWMDAEWRVFQNSLTGPYTNAIKPLVPVGQADSTETAAQITEFFTGLKSDPNCVTPGGYRGCNFWRADLHTLEMWDALRTNTIGVAVTNPPVIANVAVPGLADTAATVAWSTDLPADSAVDFGLSPAYGNSLTNAALVLNHALDLTNLVPATTYHFRVKSRTSPANGAASADFTFATNPQGVVRDLVVDNPGATVVGTWSTGTSAPGHYGGDYLFHGPGTGLEYVEFTPRILKAGRYEIYEWHSVGANRTTNAAHVVTGNGGLQTIGVNQELNGGQWNLLGAFDLLAGTTGSVRITDWFPEPSGHVVIADAVKFVYVPPPAVAPRISGQPQSQTVKAGSNVTFTVTAAGTEPLAYQWFRNGGALTGATASSYTRVNVGPGDAGGYSVTVTNRAGTAVSSNALLTVVLPPPTEFTALTVLPDGRVELGLRGEPGGAGVLQQSGDLQAWTDLFVFTNRTGTFQYTDDSATNARVRFYRTGPPP